MDLLLDTHTFLWLSEYNSKLSERAKTEIEQTSNTIFISIATLWEIGIKLSSGKLKLIRSFEEMMDITHENGIEVLPITEKNILVVS